MNTKGILFILAGAVLTVILYFLFFSNGAEFTPRARKAVPNVQEAKAYDDLVAQIFEEKCVSCHGANKQKGKLRLDNPEMILKGGKSRNLLVKGSPEESELFIRIMYDLNDDDHMPPKDKSQLSKNDIALLHWWIKEGNDFTKQVKEIKQSDSIKKILASFQRSGDGAESATISLPKVPVAPGDQGLIDSLRAMGITVIPIAAVNNYLAVSFLNAQVHPDTVLGKLSRLKEQVISLKLSDSKFSDTGAIAIASLQNLTKLYADRTQLTDSGLKKLTALQHLQYLNLTATAVTAQGVMALKGMSDLKSIYLYQTNIKTEGFIALKNAFPGVLIDSGGYSLPFMANDTVVNR
jgi:mono/diheme cytochrome c family protein